MKKTQGLRQSSLEKQTYYKVSTQVLICGPSFTILPINSSVSVVTCAAYTCWSCCSLTATESCFCFSSAPKLLEYLTPHIRVVLSSGFDASNLSHSVIQTVLLREASCFKTFKTVMQMWQEEQVKMAACSHPPEHFRVWGCAILQRRFLFPVACTGSLWSFLQCPLSFSV